jgi:anti-sigma factor RsiW
MAGESENLDATGAMLLMYLFDELSPADKLTIERKLQGDSELQARLEELRQANAAYEGALRSIDSSGGVPAADMAAARRASRLMKQWAAGRSQRPRVIAKSRDLRVPWWGYPIVSAAAILVALVFWGLNHHDQDHQDISQPPPVVTNDVASDQTPAPAAAPPSTAAAIAELPADERQDLLAAFGRNGNGGNETNEPAAENSDQNDTAMAVGDNSNDLDNIFLGLGDEPQKQGGTR